MKTLTVTDARARLGYWINRARRGEEIGIISGADLFELRPVQVTAIDYAEREYGLTKEEMDRAAKRILAESARDRAAGRLIPVDQLAAAVAARRKARGDRRPRRAA